ncbi:oxidoreductase, partial [Apiospora arundinis]
IFAFQFIDFITNTVPTIIIMASTAKITTPLTALLGMEHPIMLAGMDSVAGPELAAAVTNAGGFGTLGGARYTPDMLREMIADMKARLVNKDAPFGVDLLVPQVGGSARKTNYDYTKGHLNELVDIIIESKAKLFVSAVGVPPAWAVEKLHKAGILYMHVHKACQAGADIICAQGGEAGGHTGDIPTRQVLFPLHLDPRLDIVKQYKSPLTGKPVLLVTGGGVNDGRSLASSLMLGASGVWVGTRFTASVESKYPESVKKEVIEASYDSWVRSLIWSGRPLRALRTPYVDDWEANRQNEIKDLTSRGLVPLEYELEKLHHEGKLTDEIEEQAALRLSVDRCNDCCLKQRLLIAFTLTRIGRPIGIVAGSVNKPGQTAAEIVNEMVKEAADLLGAAPFYLAPESKL